ncbi:carboxylate-amine ligase [Nocardioides sambongensis]|uniref:carboxylate-amine ligase n=1 Tax=Nocardioides sambongensis TaxID=2589074 RepID=UPI00112B4DCC|nr:glutamate--cysteine ligase [Nocardioides sambongensis]
MVRRLGVEEELLLVDPDSGRPRPVAAEALRDQRADTSEVVESELFRYQVETATDPCTGLDELADQLRARRRAASAVAESVGVAAVAVPTPVLADEGDEVTRAPRYERIRQEFGELARTSLACAMHVHVEVAPQEGVAALDAIAPWLPALVAVSANSPYVRGRDTGYASWRTQVWSSWPSNGTGQAFGSSAEYDRVRAALVQWGAALDEGMVYFDARLSAAYPTLEVRVADVCTDLDDALLVAALVRGLVATAADGALTTDERWRSDLLRAANWRASRYGLSGQLVHPIRMELAPARAVVEDLVHRIRPALGEAGDDGAVADLMERLLARGGGATRQRRVRESRGTLEAVVADLVERTRVPD